MSFSLAGSTRVAAAGVGWTTAFPVDELHPANVPTSKHAAAMAIPGFMIPPV
jgi:hypothetical protein